MINKILVGIFTLITNLVSVILLPIDSLISSFFPDLTNILNLIQNFFTTIFTFANWCLDSLLVNSEVLSFFILIITAKITLPFTIKAIKLAISWYNSLKP